MTPPETSVRPVPLPSSRAEYAAHLADGHGTVRVYGRATLGELDWEHHRLHLVGDAPGHVHDWGRWGPTMSADVINLAASCGPLPGGAELASREYRGNLHLSIEGVLGWTTGMRWGIRVEKPTTTASGRAGKPQKVLTLVATDEQNVPDLLRAIATMWEQGEVKSGESYPAKVRS